MLCQAIDQFLQGHQLLLIHQCELLNEINKMLEACVEVGFLAEGYDFGEVTVVDVCVDSEEAFEDIFDYALEVFRERNTDL